MTVYVLKLENDKYYVGKTTTFERRIRQHFSGQGAEWTRLHKPIKILEKLSGDKIIERNKTLEYMYKFGWKNVRGSGWSQREMNIPKEFQGDLKGQLYLFV